MGWNFFINVLFSFQSNDFIIDNISFFVTQNQLIFFLFILYKRGGNTLLIFLGVHIEAVELLKRFAFLQ